MITSSRSIWMPPRCILNPYYPLCRNIRHGVDINRRIKTFDTLRRESILSGIGGRLIININH